jgi:hypothetical protein
MDVPTFRAVLPEFADATRFPDAQIQFNINLAEASLPPEVWGDRLEAGLLYYAAHYVALSGPQVSGGSGAAYGVPTPAPGLATGLVASKSVSGVSVSYDTATGQTEGGGSFNLTRYGQIFLTLALPAAAGARQL